MNLLISEGIGAPLSVLSAICVCVCVCVHKDPPGKLCLGKNGSVNLPNREVKGSGLEDLGFGLCCVCLYVSVCAQAPTREVIPRET